MSKIQFRGHCQCCGRVQAVLHDGAGCMSKHGYRVKDGWFQGVCPGQNYKPLNIDRTQADRVVADVRDQVANDLKPQLEGLKRGRIHPAVCEGHWNGKERKYDKVAWEDAAPHQRQAALQAAIWKVEQRIKAGESFAASLEALANKVHGMPLEQVKADEGPEPIPWGDKRKSKRGALEAVSIDRGMVRWKDEKGFSSKMSTRSWRLLEKA